MLWGETQPNKKKKKKTRMTQVMDSLGHTTMSGTRPTFPSRRAKISCKQWPGKKIQEREETLNKKLSKNIQTKWACFCMQGACLSYHDRGTPGPRPQMRWGCRWILALQQRRH